MTESRDAHRCAFKATQQVSTKKGTGTKFPESYYLLYMATGDLSSLLFGMHLRTFSVGCTLSSTIKSRALTHQVFR